MTTGAEVFGVALGDQVDLRELRHYVGSNEQRIYRDGSTDRFLKDVVGLLNETNCSNTTFLGGGFSFQVIHELMKIL